jgi:lysosomal-associated transmembrane protein
VKTGTICLGFYHLIIQMVAISALLFAISRPEIFWDNNNNNVNDKIGGNEQDGGGVKINPKFIISTNNEDKSTQLPELPTPQPLKSAEPTDDNNYFSAKSDVMIFTRKRLQNGDAHLALALLVGLFFITSMLLHGVAKNRPGYLLPFFCFQVFDLILSCLTAVGHYTWLPNLQEVLADNPDLPFREQLVDLNSQWMALCILTAYMLVLFAKAYFIGVVWACYQYLHLRQVSVLTYTMSEDGRQREDGELLLPPDYESAMKMPQAGAPPPPYGNA